MVFVILICIVIALVTIFSVQNALPVAVSFLFWNFKASLAIIIFLSLLSGVFIGVVIAFFLRKKNKSKRRNASVTNPAP